MSNDTDCGYDLQGISRFVNTVLYNRPSNDPKWLLHAKSCREDLGVPELQVTDDMISAALALRDAIYGVDLHKKFNLHKKPHKDNKTPPKKTTINNPEYGVVMASLNGEITTDEARQILMDMMDIGKRQAQRFYAVVSPSAKNTLKTWKQTYKNAGWGEFKAMSNESTPTDEAIAVARDKCLKYTDKVKKIQTIMGFSTYQQAQQHLKGLASHKKD